MSKITLPNGMTYEGTPEECAEFFMLTAAQKAPAPARQQAPAPTPAPTRQAAPWPAPPMIAPKAELVHALFPGKPDFDALALRFLQAVRDNKSDGINANSLMPVLGVHKDVKGIGSRVGLINKALVNHGYKPSEVYLATRDKAGNRIWRPAERMNDAILHFEILTGRREAPEKAP